MADKATWPRTVARVKQDSVSRAGARRRTASAPTRRGRRAPAVLGVEVDGRRATGVLVVDGHVTQVLHGRGEDAASQAGSVLTAAGPVSALRVAAPLCGTRALPFVATGDLQDRAEFELVAYRRSGASPETSVVAGIFDVDGLAAGQTAPGIVLVAPRAPIDRLYGALGSVEARVASPAAHASPLEGLSLALRDEHAELTLVVAGRVVACAELAAGGLGALDVELGQGTSVGTTRLGDALMARADDIRRSDPAAAAALHRYMSLVASQVAATMSHWALGGHLLPTAVYIHGRGGRAPFLHEALAQAGLGLGTISSIDKALALAEPLVRPRLVTAYLAALSEEHERPQWSFVNPEAVAAARARAARSRRSKSRLTLAAATAALALGGAVPFLPASADAWAARQGLDAQIARTASTHAVSEDALRDYLAGVASGEPSGLLATTRMLNAALAGHSLIGVTASKERGLDAQLRTDAPSSAVEAIASVGLVLTASHYDDQTGVLDVSVSTVGSS